MSYTGYTLPTAAESEAGAGENWATVTNILTYNTARATVGFTADDQVSDYLVASTFGFDVPDDATITGIEVELYSLRNNGAAPGTINDVQLRDSTGDNTGLDFADTAVTDGETQTLGSPSTLWTPTRAWTAAKVNASTFAVALKLKAAAAGTTIQSMGVGAIRVRVWYTEATTGSGLGIGIGSIGL